MSKFSNAAAGIIMSLTAFPAGANGSIPVECRVNFMSDVTNESMELLLYQLGEAQELCEGQVSLFVNSGGGDINAGMFILPDLLAMDLHTHVRVEAGSMAVPIFMAGTRRTMSPQAVLFFHEVGASPPFAYAGEMLAQSHRLVQLQAYYADFVSVRSGMSAEEVLRLMRDVTFTQVQDALDLGLTHEVVDY